MKCSAFKYIVLFLSLIPFFSSCNDPESEIVNTSMKTFGGKSSDICNSVMQTADEGYIIAGATASYGAGFVDLWIIKSDALGNNVWSRAIGGSEYDAGYFIDVTTDGGYIIVGETESYGAGESDMWLVKVDSLGEEEWTKTFGGSQWDVGHCIQQTSDGGYIIVGVTESYGAGQQDIWLIKTDPSSGETLWTKTFGGTENDLGYSLQQTFDNGYIICGSTESYGAGSMDIWLIKTDASGDTLWTRTFGGTENDLGYFLQETSDNGYVICGVTESYGAAGPNIWLIKTDESGEPEWSNPIGGIGYDFGYSVQQASDGGYVIVGSTQSYSVGGMDVWLVMTNELGNVERTVSYGGSEEDIGKFIQQTSDGGYIIAGYTNSFGAGNYDVFLIKTDKDGYPVFSI